MNNESQNDFCDYKFYFHTLIGGSTAFAMDWASSLVDESR